MADIDEIDQDEMAAAMAAMADDEEEAAAQPAFRAPPERVLNQDEIDSLLGFEVDNEDAGDKRA